MKPKSSKGRISTMSPPAPTLTADSTSNDGLLASPSPALPFTIGLSISTKPALPPKANRSGITTSSMLFRAMFWTSSLYTFRCGSKA